MTCEQWDTWWIMGDCWFCNFLKESTNTSSGYLLWVPYPLDGMKQVAAPLITACAIAVRSAFRTPFGHVQTKFTSSTPVHCDIRIVKTLVRFRNARRKVRTPKPPVIFIVAWLHNGIQVQNRRPMSKPAAQRCKRSSNVYKRQDRLILLSPLVSLLKIWDIWTNLELTLRIIIPIFQNQQKYQASTRQRDLQLFSSNDRSPYRGGQETRRRLAPDAEFISAGPGPGAVRPWPISCARVVLQSCAPRPAVASYEPRRPMSHEHPAIGRPKFCGKLAIQSRSNSTYGGMQWTASSAEEETHNLTLLDSAEPAKRGSMILRPKEQWTCFGIARSACSDSTNTRQCLGANGIQRVCILNASPTS